MCTTHLAASQLAPSGGRGAGQWTKCQTRSQDKWCTRGSTWREGGEGCEWEEWGAREKTDEREGREGMGQQSLD